MTPDELKSKAVVRRILVLKTRNWLSGIESNILFNEIQHYFNEDDEEIGYVSFPYTRFESVFVFDTPRIWSKEFFKEYTREEL